MPLSSLHSLFRWDILSQSVAICSTTWVIYAFLSLIEFSSLAMMPSCLISSSPISANLFSTLLFLVFYFEIESGHSTSSHGLSPHINYVVDIIKSGSKIRNV